jgi:hypothetical protein
MSEAVPEELPEYRPVSKLAVAALGAGIASCLVLFTPLAAMLPLVAIALAVVALAEIRKSEGGLAGRWPALGGLALAIGFVSQTLATTLVDGMVAKQRATATAVSWITAIREGRLDDALSVSSPRALMAIDVASHGEAVDPEARRRAFQSMPEVTAVAKCHETPPLAITAERSEGGWVVRVSLEDCGSSQDLTLAVASQLVVRRSHPVEEWRIDRFTLEP